MSFLWFVLKRIAEGVAVALVFLLLIYGYQWLDERVPDLGGYFGLAMFAIVIVVCWVEEYKKQNRSTRK